MTLVGSIPGPTEEVRRQVDRLRRCFRCRKHLRHVAVLLDYTPELREVYAYYDPVWVLRCAGCGGDHTYFPGTGPA